MFKVFYKFHKVHISAKVGLLFNKIYIGGDMELNMSIIPNKICISIIVPVFNAAEFLPQCLDSILHQTFCNFELILVDDGSKDGSDKLCDSYAQEDKRVLVIHKENGGPCTARNTGIDAARGEYIGFVDADDSCDPLMFATLYDTALKTSADMVFCDYTAENENGSRNIKSDLNGDIVYDSVAISKVILPYFFGYKNSELRDYKAFFPFADYNSYVWLCLYKTSLIKENNLFFPSQNTYYNEDNLFNLNVVYHSSAIAHVAKYLYHYRDIDNSLTKRYNPGFLKSKLNKFDYLSNFILENACDENFNRRLQNKICVESINIINYYINSTGIGLKEKYAKIREIVNAPAVSDALKNLNLSSVPPLSMLGIFLRFEKNKAYFMLLLLCEGYKLARR
jgi:glycosyltransferase involved in cell wall biosynthesis